MTPRRTLPLAIGLVALAAGVAAPGAGAAKQPKIKAKYTYVVSLKGTQKTTWTYNHVDQGRCDADQSGSGSQIARFRSSKVRMHTYDGLSQPIFFRSKPVGTFTLPLRGTVTRQGSITTAPVPEDEACADGGGDGSAPTPPDCGTKSFKNLVVEPTYEFKKDRIVLEQGDNSHVTEFENCPDGGDPWPYLLSEDAAGRTIGRRLPYKDLFRYGKHILVGKGTFSHDDGESKWTTTIRWELTLKRVKVERFAD